MSDSDSFGMSVEGWPMSCRAVVRGLGTHELEKDGPCRAVVSGLGTHELWQLGTTELEWRQAACSNRHGAVEWHTALCSDTSVVVVGDILSL